METSNMDPDLKDDFEAVGELTAPDPTDIDWDNLQTQSVGNTGFEEPDTKFPEPPGPADLEVTLPGGIFIGDQRLRNVRVRELTGADEEDLSRVKEIGAYARRLVELGVVNVEGRKVNPEVLGQMLIGDRDFLMVAIRRATFGDTLDLQITCRACEEKQEVEYHFAKDLPIREMGASSSHVDVLLRSGQRASVRLPMAADQDEIYSIADKSTLAETNTVMLQRIVESIDEMPITTAAEVKNLGMVDRKKILDTVHEHRVGPQFAEVTYNCGRCGEEGPIVLNVFDMFR